MSIARYRNTIANRSSSSGDGHIVGEVIGFIMGISISIGLFIFISIGLTSANEETIQDKTTQQIEQPSSDENPSTTDEGLRR